MIMKKLTHKEFSSKGGKARAKLPKKELSRIGKLGGRPKGKKLDKSVVYTPNT